MLFLYSGQALGADFYVDIDVGADNPAPANGTDPATPWKTLHHALNNITDGDIIHVGAGVYSSVSEEDDSQLQLNYNSVTIQGDPGGGSVLDGSGATGWTDGIVISNLGGVTIANLEIRDFSNSGVNLTAATNTTLAFCSIHDNASYGIYMHECDNTNAVKQNKIFDNPTGIYLFGDISECSPSIVNNLIYDGPVTTPMDHGIMIVGGSSTSGIASPFIYHNTINGKSTGNGISLFHVFGAVSPDIKYNIVTNFANGIIGSSGSPSPVLDYNDFFGNSTNYGAGLPAPTNSISMDPLYSDEVNYNFSLQTASPCINVATTSSVTEDLVGTTRPQGAAPDMGCYEYTAAASQTWYVDIDHPAAMDDPAYGFSTSSPWKTLHYAFGSIAPGDTLVVMSGIYNMTNLEPDAALVIPLGLSNVLIQGDDSQGAAPVIDASGAASWSTGIQVDSDMVTIRGIHVTGCSGPGIEVNGNDAVIDACRLSSNGTGILLTGLAQNNEIRGNCEIDYNAGHGIDIQGDLNVVDGSWSHHNGGAGIYVQASSTAIQMGCQVDNNGDNGIVINGDNNTVDNCSVHDNTGNGILSQSGQVLFIQGNCDIFNNTLDGVLVGAMETYVDGCRINENGRYGVFIDGTTYPWAINNSIRYGCEIFNNPDGGIFISNSSGNQIFTNTGTGAGIYDNGGQGGITVDGSSAYGNNIYNNLIYNTGAGLYVQDVGITASAIGSGSGLSISENQVLGHPGNGISIANSDGSIKRNRIEDNGTGLFITTLTVTASPEVWNNLFFSATSSMNYGIHIYVDMSGVVDNSLTVYHNTIDNAQTDGIFVERAWSTAEPSIFYNNITNYGSYGINNSGGNPVIGYNNVFAVGATGDYNGCADSGGGISSDPAYDPASPTGYSLQITSPCVNAISSATSDPVTDDFDGIGRPQPVGGDFDMGCFEYMATGADTDGDGILDAVEDGSPCLDSANPDTDGDGLNDGLEDANHNGAVDAGETNPCNADTDNDGIPDGVEDANQNGVWDSVETDPNNPDTDGDGFTDGEEVAYLSSPITTAETPLLTPGEYWVDPNLDALGTGQVDSPWNSLQRAIRRINGGAQTGPYTLQLLAGTYQVEAAGGREPDAVEMITADNLTIQGGGIGNTIIDGTDAVLWRDGLDVHNATNVVIINLEIQNFPANGIHMGGARDSRVETCSLHGNENSGIVIEGDGGTNPSSNNNIDGCEIYDNGTDTAPGVGVYVFGSVADNISITGNDIYSSGDLNHIQAVGVKISGGGPDNQVTGNTVYGHYDVAGGFGIEVVNSDAAINQNILFDNVEGITVVSESGGNADPDIRNNLIYDGPMSYMAYGIFLEINGGGDVSPKIFHNTIDGGSKDGIYLEVAGGIGTASPQVEFNIISNFDEFGINIDDTYGMAPIDFNNVWNNAFGSYAFGSAGANDISVPPEYVNEASGDYHLLSTSGCVDAIPVPTRLPLHPVTVDLDGVSRPVGSAYDTGCYEAAVQVPVYYTVTFVAGPGGSISGNTSQSVLEGSNCTSVTAVPDTGYLFAGWSGGLSGTANPLVLANVMSDQNITANFEPVYYTVTFAAGPGGSISGNTSQSVPEGSSCASVTAVPDTGYVFTGWSGDFSGMTNPLVITSVTSDRTVTANFAIITYDVSVVSGAGGRIDGDVSQTVDHGAAVATITAVPETGYHFTGWSGDYTGTENPLILLNVTSGMHIVANFEINSYDVVFNVTVGGQVSGDATQVVEHGENASPVTAVADAGFEFTGWSGGASGMSNPLTLTNVTSDTTVTANFAVNHSPYVTELISPIENTIVDPAAVTLVAGDYGDPEGDAHIETKWRIRRAGETEAFYSISTSSDLTRHTPGNIFENGVRYEWQAGYVDAGSRITSWSDPETFIAGISLEDENIPPIPPGFTMKDYRLVSFIQWPTDVSFLSAGETSTGADTTSEDFKIGTYDPVTGEYNQYPDLEIEPGRAYWMIAKYGMTLAMDGVFVSTDRDFQLNLAYNEDSGNGWNMIGSPNGAWYPWYDVEIIETDDDGNILYGPVPVAMLGEDNEYIDRRIWRWEGDGYASDDSDEFVMAPYEGVWVRAKKKNVALVFPVSAQSELLSAVFAKGKAWVVSLFDHITPSSAEAVSNDSPPMPMGVDDSDSGSDPGCFIEVIYGKRR